MKHTDQTAGTMWDLPLADKKKNWGNTFSKTVSISLSLSSQFGSPVSKQRLQPNIAQEAGQAATLRHDGVVLRRSTIM